MCCEINKNAKTNEKKTNETNKQKRPTENVQNPIGDFLESPSSVDYFSELDSLKTRQETISAFKPTSQYFNSKKDK